MLVAHVLAESFARHYQGKRIPEPDLVMENPENVREYRDAGLVDGHGSSVYLLNLLLLCGAIRPGMKVLDLACGPANLLVALAEINPQAEFIGVDLSPEMLRWAEELRAERGLNNLSFIRGDITNLTALGDQSVDLVMSTLALHHLPDLDLLQRCFEEMARVTRPGGAIHLMDFAALKRTSTIRYFVRERVQGLGQFLADDYENSLRAAFRGEDFQNLLPVLQSTVASARLRKTFGIPFMVAVTSLKSSSLSPGHRQALHAYWERMQPAQRKDFDALRLFFRLSELHVPDPRHLLER